ncbi:MAG: YgjV family protein [Clostridia bacterium]|nr:YgjV family protein [Clostridia bacterium]
MTPEFIIGQIFGGIAILFGFISYQVKTQRQLIFMQSATAVVFCAHYFLLGAYTGMAMNAVNIVRNIAYDYRNRKGKNEIYTPVIFAVVQAVIGILTWNAWYSVFIFLGLITNTVCMSFKNPQNVRKSIVVTSPLVFAYDAFADAWGGMIYELVAWISAIIGIFRMRKSAETADTEKRADTASKQ